MDSHGSNGGKEDENTSKRRHILKAAGASTIAGLAGCVSSLDGSGQSGRDNFKIGVVTSLSGDLRYGGSVTKRGYTIWKDTINSKGGIKVGNNRHKVKLVYADAKSKQSVATSATRKMISNENVDAILGPYSSKIPLAIGPLLDKTGTPCITGSSESPKIWKQKFNYLFGTIPSVNIYIANVAKMMLTLKPKAGSVYVTGTNGPFASAAARGFRDGAKKAGADIAGFSLYPLDADRSSIVTKAKSTDPDIHVNTGNPANMVKFIKAAKQQQYNPNAFFQKAGINTDTFKKLGSAAKYTFGGSLWLPQVGRTGGALWGSSKKFAQKFNSKYDKSPNYTEGASAATGVVYQKALSKLGSKPPLSDSDKKELMSTLENITVDTFWGQINYEKSGDNYHNNTKTQAILMQLDSDLKTRIVLPSSDTNYRPKYPVPAFNSRSSSQ